MTTKYTKHNVWHILADKKYHHFIAEYEDGFVKYYVDGELVETREDPQQKQPQNQHHDTTGVESKG